MLPRRKKKDHVEKAAEIIAKHHAKRERNSGIFTELQEEKRRQLGLHPTLRPDPKKVRDEKKFSSVNELVKQIDTDVSFTKNYFKSCS